MKSRGYRRLVFSVLIRNTNAFRSRSALRTRSALMIYLPQLPVRSKLRRWSAPRCDSEGNHMSTVEMGCDLPPAARCSAMSVASGGA
jgi:hypothetical protein